MLAQSQHNFYSEGKGAVELSGSFPLTDKFRGFSWLPEESYQLDNQVHQLLL